MSGIAAPVVVGVDGSANGLYAVSLAVGEAARRRRNLHIVHALTPADGRVPGAAELPHEAERILQDAAGIAAESRPGVPVTTESVPGAPAEVLLAKAAEAELLVIGHRGLGGFTSLLLGSVAVQTTSHSAAAVLVARGEEHPGGQVVVGVDGSAGSNRAVEAAFIEADLRDTGLCAVHTWTGPVSTGPGNMLPLVYDVEQVESEEKLVLAEALGGFRERFPDVAVRELLIRGRPARSLLHLSETALLLVVGSRGRGGFTGLMLGSVSQQVLHHSSCPVLVIPPVDRSAGRTSRRSELSGAGRPGSADPH